MLPEKLVDLLGPVPSLGSSLGRHTATLPSRKFLAHVVLCTTQAFAAGYHPETLLTRVPVKQLSNCPQHTQPCEPVSDPV